jgi:hypothetical protein
MADLIVYLPNHGYSNSDPLFVSWLDVIRYVSDKTANSFKLTSFAGAGRTQQFQTSITDGYVREDDGDAASATISGLDHLEGELVYVVSSGVFIGAFTVSGGDITVPNTVTTYQVGLLYTAKIRTMRLEIPTAPTNQSRIKRINETVLRAMRSKNVKAGQEYKGREYLTEMQFEYSNSSEDRTIPTEGGFTEDAYTVIKSDTPFPVTALATIVTFEIEERR